MSYFGILNHIQTIFRMGKQIRRGYMEEAAGAIAPRKKKNLKITILRKWQSFTEFQISARQMQPPFVECYQKSETSNTQSGKFCKQEMFVCYLKFITFQLEFLDPISLPRVSFSHQSQSQRLSSKRGSQRLRPPPHYKK